MKKIGFPISKKENEFRRALVPADILRIKNPEALCFETGYGKVLGLSDWEYEQVGAVILSREEVIRQDIICDPKVGDADYLSRLQDQTIFGWIHAVQNRRITDTLVENGITAYAWEEMFHGGRHVFWRNNELAGEAAVMHAFQCYGCMPYDTKVAVIGNGNTARGAVRILNMLGAHVVQYGRKTEALLREELEQYDVIINCVLWDVHRKDHIISMSDLNKMKRNSMIIDISCDRCGGIESSIPTTINSPTYEVKGILHYAVDHTPALFHKTFTYNNSKTIVPYIEMLVDDDLDSTMQNALIVKNGEIVDYKIKEYQER